MLAVGDSNAPSPTTLSSLTVEPQDLWPCPEHSSSRLRQNKHFIVVTIEIVVILVSLECLLYLYYVSRVYSGYYINRQ